MSENFSLISYGISQFFAYCSIFPKTIYFKYKKKKKKTDFVMDNRRFGEWVEKREDTRRDG